LPPAPLRLNAAIRCTLIWRSFPFVLHGSLSFLRSHVPMHTKVGCRFCYRIKGRIAYTARMMKTLDDIDRRIIAILESDGRAGLADIGKAVGLSGPAVGERLRRLHSSGVIEGFTVRVDPHALGYTLEAIVRIKPRSGQIHIVEQMIRDEPRFTACDRVTGDDCFVARLALISVAELDAILLPLHARADTSTSVVKSSLLRDRMPPLSPQKASG
jgi:Lrp/AsnC family transcriptional regulator, leucine-responsive regulatory protein